VGRSITQQLLYLEGERFIAERRLLRGLLQPGMHVIDVGANIGYYVLLFVNAVGPNGRVTAVEPSPENLPELRATVDLNSLSNVRIEDLALGAEDGLTRLKSGINSGVTTAGNAAYADIPVRTLDEIARVPVHFVKIDVDGYEGQVIEGASGVLSGQKPTLFLEFHPHLVGRFGYSFPRVLELLRPVYGQIDYYEFPLPSQTSGLQKIADRYLGLGCVHRIDDIGRLTQSCESGERNQTFWMVCRP
jgi:FkbM family methyltransferase